ncbi:MAG: hypothetical protein Q7S61_01330 [bacterium]|nr:hypothetical protein [bacterium]
MVTTYTPIDDLVKKLKDPLVSSLHKEAEPMAPITETGQIHEVVEHEITDEELKPHVEVRKETVKLPPDLQKLGIQSASSNNFPGYKPVKLPLSDDRVLLGLHAPITSSLRWLAEFSLYLLIQAHLTVKVIHGKVVRVIKR